MPNTAFSITTPAKINLYLRVLGRRRDGYHAIETIFLPLESIADRLTLTVDTGTEIRIRCSAAGVPTDERNLCWRAARAFLDAAGHADNGVVVELEKHIPVAAGLGGGSSDAAAVLRALNEHYGHPLGNAELRTLACSLGADVPFFLLRKPALGTGIGECLQPVDLHCDLDMVLVHAGFPVSAAWAYAHWNETARCTPAANLPRLLAAMRTGDTAAIAADTANDLEHALLRKFPLLRLLTVSLREAGADAVHVSGSGQTLFALCPFSARSEIATRMRTEYGTAIRVWEIRVAAGTPECEQPEKNTGSPQKT